MNTWEQKPSDWRHAEWEVKHMEMIARKALLHVSNYDLVRMHHDITMICSVTPHMRKVSGPIYQEILRRYETTDDAGSRDLIGAIIKFLDVEDAGMNVMLLLWDTLKIDPPKEAQAYKEMQGTGFAQFNVADCRLAWLNWAHNFGIDW